MGVKVAKKKFVKKSRPYPKALVASAKARKGEPRQPKTKTLLGRVRQILSQRSKIRGGKYDRLDDVAEAFAQALEKGSFIHAKEFIDREEGKVPSRMANADGENIKMYVGLPTDDHEDAP